MNVKRSTTIRYDVRYQDMQCPVFLETPMVNIWHSHIFPKIGEQTCLLSGKLVIGLQPDTIILHNMNHRQSTYNLSIKTKWQSGVTQGEVYCHLASYRKSSSFVKIMFTEIKRDVALNLKYT